MTPLLPHQSSRSSDPDLHAGHGDLAGRVRAPQLLRGWVALLDGVEERLRRGVTVADVGCGRGAATLILALSYPRSTFRGFDANDGSLAMARAAARSLGVENVRFDRAAPHEFPGRAYDLVTTFDALRYLDDARAVADRVREALIEDGVWMIVEPRSDSAAGDAPSSIARLLGTKAAQAPRPAALSRGEPSARGEREGARSFPEIAWAIGFARFHQIAETPFRSVFEVVR